MKDFRKLLSQMTIEEKIGQLTQYNANLFIQSDADITGPMADLGLTKNDLKNVGSVLNFKNAKEVYEIQKKHLEKAPHQIPMVFMMDVIHGYRTIFPIPLALGCSFDMDLVEELSRMAAKEAAAGGIQVTFTPMVDYVRDARWGRVMETCGEDVLLNSRMGAAQVKAFQNGDIKQPDSVATCVKHFAAYGGAEAGRDYNTVEISEHALREYYLPAYKACIDAGVDMLMPSFNTLNGVPSIANEWLMQDVLRKEWGFDGVVISDYNAVGELLQHGVAENLKDAAKLAFKNGCHIEMCSSGYIQHLKELIEESIFTQAQLDEAVLKVLQFKDKLGLFEDPYHGMIPENEEATCLTVEHRALARKGAAECAVLLKNDGILPLSKEVKKVALIGPLADEHEIIGFWACRGRNEESITVAEGICKMIPDAEIMVVKGCGNRFDDCDTSGFAEAVEAAKQADVVILCLGEPQKYAGEGNSRTDICLPGVQTELALAVAKANENTVAVTFSGRPLAIPKLDAAIPAILHMWMPGTEGGNAVADLLFGDVNPSGKLSMSFPKAVGQCPIYYNHMNTGRPKSPAKESRHVGYCSNYIDCGNLPLYSFGHGLSYSEFVYEDLCLSSDEFQAGEKITVSISVRNNSDRDGKETVMLYMRDMVASNARPVQQLIDFKKIEIKAGEIQIVTFEVDETMLRFWNNRNEWVSESGLFQISTGYADHLILTKNLYLK
ncbi:MAG: beta-glucosidase BglX [Agathobacter sp.]|nr:beta-glucosidase BglX [Agathobacter sp.]